MTDTARRWLKGLLLLAVSGGLLAFVLSQVQLEAVGATLAGADPALLALAVVWSFASFAVMPTIRWQSTLQAMGYALSFRDLVFARFGAVPLKFTIPLKGGEAFRAVYIQRRLGVPLTGALASILFDLFLVAIGQLCFLCVGLTLADTDVQPALWPTLGLLAVGIVLSSRRAQGWLLGFAGVFSRRFEAKVKELAHGFLRFPPSTKLRLITISLLVEFTEIFSMFLCLRALGVDSVPLWAVLAIMPVVMGITLIPVTIRGIGTRELAILVLFASFATPEQLAGAALLYTFVEFILPAIVGCVFLSPFLRALAIDPVPEEAHEPGDAELPAIWRFLGENKRWWLLPAALVLAAFALLALLTGPEQGAPFLY